MAKTSPIQTNFTSGELSELIAGRVDVGKYFNGASILENFYPLQYGGADRRPGTIFVAEVKDSSKSTRLISFEFSTTDTYIIEVGNQYARFFRNGGSVLEANKTITAATAANPVVITSNGHGYLDGEEILISGVVGMTEINNKRFLVANKTANTFELHDKDGNAVNGLAYTAYVSDGVANRVYEVATPYLEADIFEIDFTQSADKIYLAHQDYAPRELTRTGHTSWTLSLFNFEGGPFQPANTSAITMTPSLDTVGAGRTLTASAAYFTAAMVGGLIQVKDGWAEITGYTNTTTVTIEIFVALGTGPGATLLWAIGSWSDEFGYPGSVAFMEQRLFWASSPTEPQTIWGSETGVFENHLPGSNDADPINVEILNTKVNAVDWMLGGTDGLACGTRAGVSLLDGGGVGDAITPSNQRVRRETTYGSKKIKAKQIGENVYYVQRDGRTMREFAKANDVDINKALDMTILSSHILTSGIVDMDYQQSPNNILWCVRTDGVLAALTREIDQEVAAWSRHIIAGSYLTGSTVTESIATTPVDTYDQVWLLNKRTINSHTRRYVEYFAPPIFEDLDHAFFVDSGLTYDDPIDITGATAANPVVVTAPTHGFSDGDTIKIYEILGMTELNGNTYKIKNKTANTFELTDEDDVNINGSAFEAYVANGIVRKKVSTITGLDHLEGETVSILADGSVLTDEVVVNGAIALQSAAAVVNVGLHKKSRLQTMRFEGGSVTGTSQAKHKRIYELGLRIYRTVGFNIGASEEEAEPVEFRTADMDMDEPVPLYTGDKLIPFPPAKDGERDGYVYIEQDQPLPCTIIAIMPKAEVHDT